MSQRSIRTRRINHMNLVVEDFDASVAYLTETFDGVMLLDMQGPAHHACLVDVGGVILELFAPHSWLLVSRYGPHYLGIEYQAPDMEAARAIVGEQGIGIVRDIGEAFHTHPADGFGVAFEFWHGSFHENEPPSLTTLCRPVEYWRDHPLRLTGQKAYTVAVNDIDAASGFFQDLLGARPAYDEMRPALGARAMGLEATEATIELLSPTDERGALRREMAKTGEGIRSTVFRTADLAAARAYFEGRGVELAPGSAPDRFALALSDRLGVWLEFAE